MLANSAKGILKPLWTRRSDGRWGIHGLKGIMFEPKPGFEADYFAFDSKMELLTNAPPKNIHDMFASFGPTDFIMKQSILPVVAWIEGDAAIRCVGTAFIVSCTGYAVTACHVLLDPRESGYGELTKGDGDVDIVSGFSMGVLMPISPATGIRGFYFIPFQEAWYWGTWRQGPLIHEGERFDSLTDIAVFKLPERPLGAAYQPLSLSLFPFIKAEHAYAIGYAAIKDIPIEYIEGRPKISEFDWDLYVSIGEVSEVFPQNHLRKEVPTPGPSFDFRARIPGKMSGAPIFGAKGSVVRGVVSRSFSGEKHAYGCMIGPAMTLPFTDGKSLKSLMDDGNDGIAVVNGRDL